MAWFSRDAKVSPERFAELVSEALRGAGFDVMEPDMEDFMLRGAFGLVNLGNFFKSYNAASRKDRDRIVASIVSSARVARDHEFPSWDDAAPHLRAVIRSVRFHQTMALAARAEDRCPHGIQTAHTTLAPGLTLELAYDTETVTTSVPLEQLTDWGVSFEEALERAVRNLRDLEEPRFDRAPSGFYIVHARDGYESGRMATPDLFHRLELAGDPVVLPSIRNAMLVAGSNDVEALLGMAETALDLMHEGQWVSFSAFVHDGEGWARFRPDYDHPVYESLRKLELIELREDYESQRNFLGRLFGTDVFIPQLILGEKAGRVRSFATWGEGITALLPEAESIVFSLMDPDDPEAYGEMIDVTWDDMFEIVGHRISRMADVEPHRYCTESWPTQAELEELRTRSARPESAHSH